MAFIDCKFYSETLGFSASMNVILPQNTESQIGMENVAKAEKYKTLYLLHGLSDDHTIWMRRTSIERYVAPLGIAVVMPAAHRSFYTDMACGGAYEKFIAEELPSLARSFFPLSDAREDNYIAGLSMGGYGAFKIALNHPDNYCAAASLSGVLNLASLVENTESNKRQDFINVFGDTPSIKGTRHDLFHLAKTLKSEGKDIPRLFICCGDEDGLCQGNIAFRDLVEKENIPFTWHEDPGCGHSWDYWDMRIQTVLEWMFE